MSLLVWLPLNGDLHNQGLSDVTVTNNGATVSDAGKIGRCYRFETNAKYITLNKKCCDLFNDGDSFSYCFWIKISAYSTAGSGSGSGGTVKYLSESTTVNGTSVKGGGFGVLINSSGHASAYANPFGDMFGVAVGTIPLNAWTHIIMTYDKSTRKLSTYKNGQYVSSSVLSNTNGWGSNGMNFIFGKGSQGGWQNSSDNYQNDIRIYDHCLSPKEIKEISKGLILHYKLDGSEANGIGNTNLIANGWGGVENWGDGVSTSGVSTDVPEGVTGVTNSYSNKLSREYILLNSDHSYTISEYTKRGTSATNYLYITCIPYDIDKLQIVVAMQPDGFIVASRTTLSQDLNPGDTVVHLTSAAGWSTTSTYAYRIAIFGYKDSTGYTYPDMIYTRRIYAWGSTTDKSHLDKTNNTVTLNAAYTGEKIPAGTTVCQTGDGSTYYYAASVNSSGHEGIEWFFLTRTFTPSSVNYLKAAKYIRIYSTLYSGQWGAAITLIDNTAESIIEDTSGYCNNGKITGQLSMSVDTPRYSKSIEFDGISSGIQINNLYISDIINNAVTYSFWIKPNGENGARSVYFGSYSSTSWSIEKYTNNLLRSWWNGALNYYPNVNITDNTWQMITITKNGTNEVKFYLNGELKDTNTSTHSALTFPTTFRIGRDIRSGDGTPYKGLMSDFRIYSTALSAEDVLELYNTAAMIDDGGSVYCYEFDEDSSSEIDKTGILKFNIDERGRDVNTSIYSQVQTNLLQNTIIDNFRYERTSGIGTEGGIRFTPTMQLETNKNYTLSAMIRGSANLNLYTLNTGGNMHFTYANKSDMSTQEFKLFSVTFKVTGNRTINEVYICTRYGEANTAVGDWFELQANSVKLEEGDICTPWTPATSDSIYRNYDKLLSTSQLIEF